LAEALEARVNLSSVGLPGFADGISNVPATVSSVAPVVTAPAGQTSMMTRASVATPVTPAASITVPVASYSAIFNDRLERRRGQPGADIGHASRFSGYVQYTVNVPIAGLYDLNLGLASRMGSDVLVSVNGVVVGEITAPATGSPTIYAESSLGFALLEGANVLRFTSLNRSQYNLNAIALTPDVAQVLPTVVPVNTPSAPTTGMTTTTATTDTTASAGDGAWVAAVPILQDVTITQRSMTSFTELDITGTSADDVITVTQSGDTLTINANGYIHQVTGTFGDMAIWGGAGNDVITVDSSVTIDTRVYGQAGNNIITDATSGKPTIVTIGGGSDVVTGNGVNTSFWVDPTDVVNASGVEIAAKRVHIVSGFYQPYTNTPGAPGYVSNQLDGSTLTEPASDGSGWTTLPNSSLWGTGPVMQDVNQGQVSDCYFLTTLQSLARWQPDKLRELAVDLGDGTYAVQMYQNGVTQYVRVDGELPTAPWGGLLYAYPGSSGNMWAVIMEKAYAYFRMGQNSYASLNFGWMTSVYPLWRVNSFLYTLPSDQESFYTLVSGELAANKPVDIGTDSIIQAGAPLIASHCYAVMAVSEDATGTVWVTLRNPWGVDGFNWDSNPIDGLITITYAMLEANTTSGSYVA
jgi:hypothetical protein